MSYGVGPWILVFVFWIILLVKTCSQKPQRPHPTKAAAARQGLANDRAHPAGRTLSEAQSEDFSTTLNKRFSQAREFEEDDSGVSGDSLVDRPQPRKPRIAESSAGGKFLVWTSKSYSYLKEL